MKAAIVSAMVNQPLGSYNVSDVTVSGLSAGAFMAVQMHIAYSGTISGAAVYAGGPYYCAKGSLNTAMMSCMYDTMPSNIDQLVAYTNQHAASKDIDSPDNLKDDKVFLFSGRKDTTVNPKVVKALQEYYEAFMPASNIESMYTLDAAHTFPTLAYGNACSMSKDPYISKCSYDGAGEALRVLVDKDLKRGSAKSENLWSFDQTSFFKGTGTSLGKQGYVYVPSACQDGESCHLHIAFHGCEQTLADVGTDYVEHTGFNEWAENGNIIVLYPQVDATVGSNPNGCWDWWAYTDNNYALQSGVQMSFVKALIDELSI